ncbi:uncharacterized protein LOC128343164 [Hemicordylus capensis]|uniref:uncharacterized protein LOC128343164 n=1 Tax=Hemicordylus capensis TaxID=884348 RepID=UPI0023026D94|nr:uncharacterized protein LOC128343164 [Hemicordylus capensis]
MLPNWTCIDAHRQEIVQIKSGSSPLSSQVRVLDLSGNQLSTLPPAFLAQAQGLRELYLQDNRLQSLPRDFFVNATQLKVLALQGNRLTGVPGSVFTPSLETLTLSCSCDVLGTLPDECRETGPPNCSISVFCSNANKEVFNMTAFYTQNCGHKPTYLYAAVIVPIVVVLVAAGVACFLVHRRKKAAIHQEKRPSNTSEGAHGPPRYISRSLGDPSRETDHDTIANYENVFIEPPHRARGRPEGRPSSRKPSKSRMPPAPTQEAEDAPPGDQPIYANAVDLYYNYNLPGGTPEPGALAEDIYIMPDDR